MLSLPSYLSTEHILVYHPTAAGSSLNRWVVAGLYSSTVSTCCEDCSPNIGNVLVGASSQLRRDRRAGPENPQVHAFCYVHKSNPGGRPELSRHILSAPGDSRSLHDQLRPPQLSYDVCCRLMHLSALVLVYIHNHAFVSTMCENPEDSYYTSRATSYLSACRYASEIIRENIDNFRRHSQLFSRWWPTWKNRMSPIISWSAPYSILILPPHSVQRRSQ